MFIYLNKRKILTTGEDNKIKLWNIETRKCESTGTIEDKSTSENKEIENKEESSKE